MEWLFMDREERPRAGVVLWTYLYVWLMVGFFSGTLVLLGPAGWLSAALQRGGWSELAENRLLKLLIAVWFLASMLVAKYLVRVVFRSRRRPLRLLIPLTVTVLAGLSLREWLNPARMLANVAGGRASEVAMAGGARFVFGPYPDRARLAELKRDGFDAVVSLQHPALPIEVPGIREERRAAGELGLSFVHAPMLPWISDNRASLDVIRGLVRRGRGTYYVHCGLGRDRTTVVRHLVERLAAGRVGDRGTHAALTFRMRKAQADSGEVPSPGFERGLLTEVAPEVWLVPHPNPRELFSYMVAGQVAHVVAVLDSTDAEQRRWMNEERLAFSTYQVPVTFVTLPPDDSAAARRIAALALRLPRPVAVVAPRTTWTDYRRPSPGTGVASALYRALTAPAAARD